MKAIQVGLLGLGTVGTGTFNVLHRNQDEIMRRAGCKIEIAMIAVQDVSKKRSLVGRECQIVDDAMAVVTHPDIDIVVELIGGTSIAKDLVLTAIRHGKHVVTANKALLAEHGNDIFEAAQQKGVIVAFEAAVAGGVPIIKSLREGLTANRIVWVAGIINGTTNYILSQMRQEKVDFQTALRQAQALGYAEADPRFDIEGVDAAHKMTLLSAIAFGVPMQFDRAHIEGISHLEAIDILYAEQFGYRIKLLAITKRTEKGIELRVHPTLIPSSCLLANVEGVMNAVLVQGDVVGTSMYYGRGAGAEPTASAVIADLVDIARLATADQKHHVPYLAFQSHAIAGEVVVPIKDVVSSYYLRLSVLDQSGVLADLTKILADHAISISAMFQKEHQGESSQADIIMLTHQAQEADVLSALLKIEALEVVCGKVVKIRLEALE